MLGNDIERLVYLIILGVLLVSYFLIAGRPNLNTTARHAVLWALIFLGVIAGVGLYQKVQGDIAPRQSVFAEEGRIEIPQSRDGHFYMNANLNGVPVRFVVDTGATDIVLSRQDAIKVGIDPDRLTYSGRAGTANGMVETARAEVARFEVGPMVDRNVPVWVNRGEMAGSLLGMAYLRRFERLEISGGRLLLER